MANGPQMGKGAAWLRFGLRSVADFIPGVSTVYDLLAAVKTAREGDPIGARLMVVAGFIDLIPVPGTSLVAEAANVINLQRNQGNLGMDKNIGSFMVKWGVLSQQTLDAHLERQGLTVSASSSMSPPPDHNTYYTTAQDDLSSTRGTPRPIFDPMTGERIKYPPDEKRRMVMPSENLIGSAFSGSSRGIDGVRR